MQITTPAPETLAPAVLTAKPEPQKKPGWRQEANLAEWYELLAKFDANRMRIPSGQLLSFWGKVVAWEPDGSAVRALGDEYYALKEQILAEGDDPAWYRYETFTI